MKKYYIALSLLTFLSCMSVTEAGKIEYFENLSQISLGNRLTEFIIRFIPLSSRSSWLGSSNWKGDVKEGAKIHTTYSGSNVNDFPGINIDEDNKHVKIQYTMTVDGEFVEINSLVESTENLHVDDEKKFERLAKIVLGKGEFVEEKVDYCSRCKITGKPIKFKEDGKEVTVEYIYNCKTRVLFDAFIKKVNSII